MVQGQIRENKWKFRLQKFGKLIVKREKYFTRGSLVMKFMMSLFILLFLVGQVFADNQAVKSGSGLTGRAFSLSTFLLPQVATGPQWKSRDEYDAFQVFVKEADANSKIAKIDAFLEKYKDTDFKEGALLTKIQAYVGLKDTSGVTKTAREILEINPHQLHALYLLSAYFQYTFQPDGPDADSSLSQAQKDAETGLDVLKQMQKPPNMSDSQFAEFSKTRRLSFNNTIGFSALQQKDYVKAINYLKAVSSQTPNDALAVYRIGIAYFNSAPIDYNNSVWYLARALSLAGAGAGSLNENEIRKFLTNVYVNRYKSEAGLSEIITQAATSANPPEGFSVPSAPEPPETATPSEKVFLTLAHPLRGGGATAQRRWDNTKGTRIPMAGKVDSLKKGSGARTFDVRIDLIANSESSKDGIYDIVLHVSGQGKVGNLSKGDIVRFEGDLDSYEVLPNFFFTMANAKINNEDLPAFARGKGPKPPPTRRSRIRQD